MLRKKWFKILRLTLVVLALLTAIAAITLYKIVTYIPKDYQPQPVDLARQEQINHYADKKMEELYNGLQIPEPFSIRFEQKPLNELLMLAQEQHWFGKNADLKKLQDPQISFIEGRFKLMARVRRDKLTGVLTIGIKPWITENGQICILLDQVKLGALLIPDSVLNPYLQRGLAKLESFRQRKSETKRLRKSREQAADDWLSDTLEKWQPKLDEFIKTQKVLTDAGFKADDTWVRILELTMDHEQLEIKLAPQPTQATGTN